MMKGMPLYIPPNLEDMRYFQVIKLYSILVLLLHR